MSMPLPPNVLRPIFLFLMLCLPVQALAHAEFRGSDPVADAMLPASPDHVALQFSEPVGALSLTWRLPDGSTAEARATGAGHGLDISAPPNGGEGTYVLNWRVASADGHPVGGALVFSIGKITEQTTGAANAASEVTAGALNAIAARFAAVLAMILSVGAAIHASFVAPLARRAQRIARLSSRLAAPLALVAIGLYGLDLLAAGPGALFSPGNWRIALAAPRGWSLLLMAGAALLSIPGHSGRKPAALGALTLGAAAMAVSGHSAAGDHALIGQIIMGAHAAALIFWIGALPALLSSAMEPDGASVMRRFSDLALPAVLVLIASGTGLIILRGLPLPVLAASKWGTLLMAKLTLVSLMLGLALWNKLRATPGLETNPSDMAPRLRRSIGAEIALGALVLLLAMGFRLTPPPKPALNEMLYAHLMDAQVMVDVSVTPAPPGTTIIALSFMGSDGNPFEPKEVTLSLSDPAAGIGPIEVRAEKDSAPDSGALWHSPPVTLPSPGPWEIALRVLITDFTQATLRGELERFTSP